MDGIECAGFTFYNDFDSANLAKVVYVPFNESVIAVANISAKSPSEIPHAEFNIWTKPDCCGTEFENGNRTWFYFGVKAHAPCLVVRLNMIDLNRQGKMYSQGMAPVYKVMPGKPQWERIRDKPVFNTIDDVFTLSFKFKTPENVQHITYFAFTYPFSYADLQKMLLNIDLKFQTIYPIVEDDIYYTKEMVCRSLGGREVNLLTITSFHGITLEQETRLKNLFPEITKGRPHKFVGKKVIFISARVHPGETPSSFVFNGFLNLLLTRDDPVAIMLRRLYVFKLVPFLNPDGVAVGHYRTDTRGVNLNRVYLNPSFALHPPVYAARALIRYYHYGFEKEEEKCACSHTDIIKNEETNQNDSNISVKVSNMSLEEKESIASQQWCMKCNLCRRCKSADTVNESVEKIKVEEHSQGDIDCNSNGSGLFLYVDMHGHASKKGIFMYGNHFQDLERNVECMLLPKLMSINNHNFHFTACNFTERNMYLRDKRDGMSREGSGRVAVLKLTGLTRSYTLECNYNTGRIVNVLPSTVKESHMTNHRVHTILVPPKYTPQVFEEVGKSLGVSILDLTGHNPLTRLPNSEFHSMTGLREWLRVNCANEMDETRTLPNKIKLKNLAGLHNQGKTAIIMKRPVSVPKRLINRNRPGTVPIERKENMVSQPSCSYSTTNEQRIKSGFRLNKPIKSKSKKDFSYKYKRNNSGDKLKAGTSRNKLKSATASSQKSRRKSNVASNQEEVGDDDERVQLKEICIVKGNEATKLLSLKYRAKEGNEDRVKVPWKPSSSSQAFSKIGKEVVQPLIGAKMEAGPSKPATYLVHNFGKNSTYSKCKFKMHSLRRLAKAAAENLKVDKVSKRKKIKSK